ncbi:MAG: 2-oxoacid:acceptor oxidoreductase subunit alpha, partial [Thermoprotei archaeon]
CSFFAGYPITPQREIMERMASRLPLLKGVFLQVEDEIAAINAVIGASWAGAKAMTATSGPGFSLMQEAIGYMVMTETPGVIVDVQRLGPATGQATKCGQGDVMQARWGRHGDQAIIALCPNSAQEMFDLTVEAFNLSERYRCPVIVLADEIVGHLRERVEVPSEDKIVLVERRRPYSLDEAPFGSIKPNGVPPMPRLGDGFNLLVTGSTHDEYGYRHTASPMVHSKLVTRLVRKIMDHVDDIVKVELQGIEEAEVGVVSYGCTSRSVYEAIKMAEDKGVKVGHVRLKTIWPFPDKPVKALSERVDVIVVPELNLGQISLEVRRVAREACRVVGLNKVGGGRPITPREVVNQLLRWRR